MRPGIDAVLFDMDGLLIDSERVGIEVLEEESRLMGTPVLEPFLTTVLGLTREGSRQRYLDHHPEVDFDRLYDLFALRMAERARAGRIPLKKGAFGILKALSDRGIPRCVASSSPRESIGIYLKALGLEAVAPDYVSSEEVSRSKPCPDVFLKAAERIGADIRRCLILEDSPNGLTAARRSGAVVGMVSDIIPFSDALRPVTDHVFKDLDRAREWLEV
ncbi:MAG: HAD family phosphatase [Clostridia bacterium]|nr:HAD family phosphatase [Clostridia bacterium]